MFTKAVKIVFPRQGHEVLQQAWFLNVPHIFLDVNIMKISSTYIRDNIDKWNERDAIKYLAKPVYSFIKEKGLYEKNS